MRSICWPYITSNSSTTNNAHTLATVQRHNHNRKQEKWSLYRAAASFEWRKMLQNCRSLLRSLSDVVRICETCISYFYYCFYGEWFLLDISRRCCFLLSFTIRLAVWLDDCDTHTHIRHMRHTNRECSLFVIISECGWCTRSRNTKKTPLMKWPVTEIAQEKSSQVQRIGTVWLGSLINRTDRLKNFLYTFLWSINYKEKLNRFSKLNKLLTASEN